MKCLGNGRLEITGQFARPTDAYFRLVLSSQVTADDISDGYVLSGDLELGDSKESMQQSHFAVVKFEQKHQHHPEDKQHYHSPTMNDYYVKVRRFLSLGCV